MSSEALAWAFKQDVKPSGAKFTLVALCECANYQTGRITPSIAHLCQITGQNRKSIIAHIDQLEKQGFISDTGEKCGKTKQIKVYSANIGTVPKTEPYRERNSSNFSGKQSQKRDTEPSLEPSSSDATHLQTERASDDCATVIETWNSMAKANNLSVCAKVSPKRRKACQARLRDDGLAAIQRAIEHIPKSSFLLGATGNWSGADIDFLLKPDSVTKILEGKYNDRQRQADRGSSQGDTRSTLARVIDEGLGFLDSTQAEVSGDIPPMGNTVQAEGRWRCTG